MENIAAASSRTVPPDPFIADALGAYHELSTALADPVDNSIDVGASQVRIRTLTDDDYVTGVLVIDDGHGMDEAGIDAIMAFPCHRDYGETDLSHYGLGLKAASLSQADTLDVYSRAIGGVPVGRRIIRQEPTLVQSLDDGQVGEVLEGSLVYTTDVVPLSGTVVRWRGSRTAVVAPDRDERRPWFSRFVENIRGHLGLVFHRIIAWGGVGIVVDGYDLGLGRAGSVRRIRALDSSALDASAAHPYRLTGEVGDVLLDLAAVILKGAVSDVPGVEVSWRLSPAEGGQGLYVYRSDRLLQLGGWSSVIDGGRGYANLRIFLDIGDVLLDIVRINPEKNGVVLGLEMGRAVHASVGQNTGTSSALLAPARSAATEGRRREPHPIRLVEPCGGLGRDVYDAVQDSVEFVDAKPIRIRWERMPENGLVGVDHERRLLKINEYHRRAFSTSSDPQDTPPPKALVFLLYSCFFERTYLGGREKCEIEAFERTIEAALSNGLRRRGT